MRVLHLLPETASAGAENQARYMLEALPLAGVEPELAIFRQGDAHELFEDLRIPIHVLGSRGPLLRDLRRRSAGLRSCVAARRPDLVHAWLFEAHLVALAALPTRGPTRLLIGQREGPGYPLMESRTRSFGGRTAVRLLRRRIACVLANSEAGGGAFRQLGVSADRIEVQGNALAEKRIASAGDRRSETRASLGAGSNAQLVVAVGRPTTEKGHDVLIAAMRSVRAELPNARLVLVGIKPDELRDLDNGNADGTKALGWRSDAPAIMAAADCVAISSRSEGHSNVADEALMLGLPVVSTDTGGHAPLVRDCGGTVVPVDDVDALAAGIAEMLRNPPDSARARDVAQEALSVESAARRLADLYRSLSVSR